LFILLNMSSISSDVTSVASCGLPSSSFPSLSPHQTAETGFDAIYSESGIITDSGFLQCFKHWALGSRALAKFPETEKLYENVLGPPLIPGCPGAFFSPERQQYTP
jgi:hypothetical protein